MADKNQYCMAKMHFDGRTHLGRIFDDVCFAVCASAHRQLLLPIMYGEIDCENCLRIMVRQNIRVNMTCVLVAKT